MSGRHECGHFLMPHLNELGIALGSIKRPQEPVDSVAGIPEDPFDSPLLQPVQCVIGDFSTRSSSSFSDAEARYWHDLPLSSI